MLKNEPKVSPATLRWTRTVSRELRYSFIYHEEISGNVAYKNIFSYSVTAGNGRDTVYSIFK